MKKINVIVMMLLVLLASCTTTKVEREVSNDFRGDWTLNQIVSDQGDKVVITNLFGHSTLECFEGSTWHLVANNNSGHYVFNGVGCAADPTDIKWYVKEEDGKSYFWFKQLDGSKAKEVTTGYKMEVISVDENEAHLLHQVPFEGGRMNIHYYFNKQ